MNNDYNGIPFLAQSCHLSSEDVKYTLVHKSYRLFLCYFWEVESPRNLNVSIYLFSFPFLIEAQTFC